VKRVLLKKKVREVNRNIIISLNPMQLKEVGIEVGEEVEVYVKGNNIIIGKKERKG